MRPILGRKFVFDSPDRLTRRVIQREGASNIVEDDSSFSFENQLDAALMKTAANGVASLGFEYGATPPFSLSEFSVAASASGNPLGLIEGNFQIGRDVTGEIASVSKNGSSIFNRSFDAAGRLTSAASGDFTSSILHDGFGRRQTVSHSNGTTGNFQYDLLNRVISVSWTGPTPISEALGYDLAGNIASLERENTSYQIGYDEVDQLVSSISTGANLYNRNFAFDLLGNRIGSNVDGPGAFVNNFLTGNSTSSFLADPDGFGETVRETTAGLVTNFTYRADGLLKGVQKGPMQASYFFDALNRRVAKTISTGSESFTQSFLHLGLEDRILQAKAGDGSITTYVDGQDVDEHFFEVKNGVGKGYVFDHLGSVLNGDAAGSAKAFHLYGEQIVAPAISAYSNPVMYGYTGREHDAESGLDYHRARARNKKTGVWLSQDPIGLSGDDLNFYRYAYNSPLLGIDPAGTKTTTAAIAGHSLLIFALLQLFQNPLHFKLDKDARRQAIRIAVLASGGLLILYLNEQNAFGHDPTFGPDECLTDEQKAKKLELQRQRKQLQEMKDQLELLKLQFLEGKEVA